MGRVNILGVDIDAVSSGQAIGRVESFMDSGSRCRVVTPNPEIVLKTLNDSDYANMLSRSELLIPDGFGLVFVSRVLKLLGLRKFSLPFVVTGVDFCELIMQLCCKKGVGVFLLGADKGVAKSAAEVWISRNDGLIISGCLSDCSREWDEPSSESAISMINASGASVVLVAFGAPHQEKWIFNNSEKCPGVNVWIGVGGTFDFVSGCVVRAPAFIRFIHMEWMWRLFTDLSRFKRIFNAVFVFLYRCIVWEIKH